jgi:two-component system, LytTR family, sensor kinase
MSKFGCIFGISTFLYPMFARQISRISLNKNLQFYFFYWIAYLLFFTTQRFFALRMDIGDSGIGAIPTLDTIKQSFYANLAFLPLVIAATHFIVDFLLPKYYFSNRFYIFSSAVVLLIITYPLFIYIIRKLVVEPFVVHGLMSYSLYNYFMAILIFVFGMVPLVWFKMAAHLKEDALFHQKLDNDRLKALLKLKETELKLLKSQIHPHFLFNTLNNLYSLALEKSDKTPDLIIRLADMLSYIIYDGNSEKVPLSKEIDFLKSFIELQRVRFESCDIDFTIQGEINNQKIAPMLLHTFVDNSFKHGAEKDTGNPWIKLLLSIDNGNLGFSVINSSKPKDINGAKATGIGIENARKRLDLIYNGRYELDIKDSDGCYSVLLKLQL